MRFTTGLMLLTVALAGCSAESRQAPVSTSRLTGGSASSEPEPSNSLPRGSSVMAPLTPPAGNVDTTRVGPATRAPAVRQGY